MIIRNANSLDKDELKTIWKERFGDDESFIEWFFKERFYPEHSRVIEADNKIVSCLYSMPMSISVAYGHEKAVLISGVSTLPDYEKRGLMRNALSHHLKDMRNKGYNISKKQINMESINTLGFHNVEIVLHKKVSAEVKVKLEK